MAGTMRYFLFRELSSLQSSFSGCAMLKEGWTHMTRKLDEDSVLILGRRNATLIDDEGDILEVKPGRFILLGSSRLHRGAARIAQSVSYYWCHFHVGSAPVVLGDEEVSRILASPEAIRSRLSRSALVPQSFDSGDGETFFRLFQELLARHREGGAAGAFYTDYYYQTLVQQLLMRLTNQVIAAFRPAAVGEGGAAGGRDSRLVPALIALIEEGLSNPDLSVKYLASNLGMNGDYLGREFRSVMGVPLGQYILKRRIELSMMRLAGSRDTVEDIAFQCGFGSVRQFLHQFKVLEGRTPTAYRAAIAQIEINTL